MSYYSPEQVRSAIAAHGTVFFDSNLNPITPEPGSWFCEFDIIDTYEGNEIVRDEELVHPLQALNPRTNTKSRGLHVREMFRPVIPKLGLRDQQQQRCQVQREAPAHYVLHTLRHTRTFSVDPLSIQPLV